MHPLLVTSGAAAATWALYGYDRRYGIAAVDLPNLPGEIEGSVWYRTFVHRLRVTTGWLTATNARQVFEQQRAAAVRVVGAESGDRQWPGVGMRHGELVALIEGWLSARAMTESSVGAIAGGFEWWIGGRSYAAVGTRALRERWNVHRGAVIGDWMVPAFRDIADQVAGADDVRETWRVLSDHATAMDALRDVEPVAGPLDRAAGALQDAAAAAGTAAADAIGAVLGGATGVLVKVGVIAGAGYLLIRAVTP
jgi:hypothetical protein